MGTNSQTAEYVVFFAPSQVALRQAVQGGVLLSRSEFAGGRACAGLGSIEALKVVLVLLVKGQARVSRPTRVGRRSCSHFIINRLKVPGQTFQSYGCCRFETCGHRSSVAVIDIIRVM